MVDWNKRGYSEEEFTRAWKTSPSIRQVAIKLGLYPTGDAYRVIQRAAEYLKLDRSHLSKIGLNTTNNRNASTAIPLEKILVKNSRYTNMNLLKRRLIRDGVLKQRCYECDLREWKGKPLVFVFDHINGVKDDNQLENLRLLCPNCDSQQPTYRGRNKGH